MSGFAKWFGQHRHSMIVVAGLACGAAVELGLTSNHWVSLGIGVATLAGVYKVNNKPVDG